MKLLTVLFLLKDDEVLLAMKKRGFGVGRWNGVGGKVELDETVEQAMIRETEEEIEVSPRIYEEAAQIFFDEQHTGEREIVKVHVFTAAKWEGEPHETEEMAPKWFNIKDIPYEQMWPDDTYWLPKILAGEKVKAHFVLDNKDRVVTHKMKTVVKFND